MRSEPPEQRAAETNAARTSTRGQRFWTASPAEFSVAAAHAGFWTLDATPKPACFPRDFPIRRKEDWPLRPAARFITG